MDRLKLFVENHYKLLIGIVAAIIVVTGVMTVVFVQNGLKSGNSNDNTITVQSTPKAKKDDNAKSTLSATTLPSSTSLSSTQPKTSIVPNSDKQSSTSNNSSTSEKNNTNQRAESIESNGENSTGNSNSESNYQQSESNEGYGAEENKNVCTISISCATINNNISKLDKSKKSIVPSDGWILQPTKVEIKDGESVFDVLEKVTKENKIHLEFSKTPAYNSVYIEGIANLYEFDCGELSGWKYRVNGEFISVGCSLCTVKSGDNIEWLYTCDLGKDIGVE